MTRSPNCSWSRCSSHTSLPMSRIEHSPWSLGKSCLSFRWGHTCSCPGKSIADRRKSSNADHRMLSTWRHIYVRCMSTLHLDKCTRCSLVWSAHRTHRYGHRIGTDTISPPRMFSSRKRKDESDQECSSITYVLTENLTRWTCATFEGNTAILPGVHIIASFRTWWSLGGIDLIGWTSDRCVTNLCTAIPHPIRACTRTMNKINAPIFSISLETYQLPQDREATAPALT